MVMVRPIYSQGKFKSQYQRLSTVKVRTSIRKDIWEDAEEAGMLDSSKASSTPLLFCLKGTLILFCHCGLSLWNHKPNETFSSVGHFWP